MRAVAARFFAIFEKVTIGICLTEKILYCFEWLLLELVYSTSICLVCEYGMLWPGPGSRSSFLPTRYRYGAVQYPGPAATGCNHKIRGRGGVAGDKKYSLCSYRNPFLTSPQAGEGQSRVRVPAHF